MEWKQAGAEESNGEPTEPTDLPQWRPDKHSQKSDTNVDKLENSVRNKNNVIEDQIKTVVDENLKKKKFRRKEGSQRKIVCCTNLPKNQEKCKKRFDTNMGLIGVRPTLITLGVPCDFTNIAQS